MVNKTTVINQMCHDRKTNGRMHVPLTRLSCPFDDIFPGVACRGRHSGQPHSASALPEAPKKTQLLPLRCRRLPGGERARVACRVMPLLKPELTLTTRKLPLRRLKAVGMERDEKDPR